MSRYKLYNHIIDTNLFNINSKRKRKTNASKSKKVLQRTKKNRHA